MNILYFIGFVFFSLLANFYLQETLFNLMPDKNNINYLFLIRFLKDIVYFIAVTVTVRFFYNQFARKKDETTMSNLIAGQLNNAVNNVFPNMVDYGLSEIHGFSLPKFLNDAKIGDSIYCLDTYCPQSDDIIDSLIDAIERGVNIKILSISVEDNFANATHRANEFGDDPTRKGAINQMTSWHEALNNMNRDRLEEKFKTKPYMGSLEVSYYDDLLGMPMYIHIRDKKPISAYTGFYLNESASKSLYLKWKPSTKNFIEKFVIYFDKKWIANEKHIAISSKEK